MTAAGHDAGAEMGNMHAMGRPAWARRAGLALMVPALAVAAGCGSSNSDSGRRRHRAAVARANAFLSKYMNGSDRPRAALDDRNRRLRRPRPNRPTRPPRD
jgi:hypothetical protein